MRQVLILVMLSLMLGAGSVAWAGNETEMQEQLAALQKRVAELEAQQSQQSVQERSAELVRQMLSEMDNQSVAEDTGVTAGYDKRFFIKSTDDQFKLEFDTRFQFRHTYQLTDDGDKNVNRDGTRPAFGLSGVDSSASAFEVERGRVYLSGHMYKDLKFIIALEGDDDSDGEFLHTYELAYSFMPELGVRLGRYKGPFSKQETTSSGRQMLIDRSLANEVYNIDRVTGVELFGQIDMGDVKPEYRVMMFNGFQNVNDAPFSENDNSPGIAGRLGVPLMGASMKDFENESDLEFHDNPVMMIGGGAAYANDRREDNFTAGNNGESDAYEILGKNLDGRSDIYELGGEATLMSADVSFKYQGFSTTVEGYYQHLDLDSGEVAFENDFGVGRNNVNPITGEIIDGHELDNFGWYAQAGYFIVPKKFELVSRISNVCVDNTNDSYEYAAGWNWYLYGQDLKLSMDVTYIDDLPMVSTAPNFDGVQNNGLFMIRSQLQFQF